MVAGPDKMVHYAVCRKPLCSFDGITCQMFVDVWFTSLNRDWYRCRWRSLGRGAELRPDRAA